MNVKYATTQQLLDLVGSRRPSTLPEVVAAERAARAAEKAAAGTARYVKLSFWVVLATWATALATFLTAWFQAQS